MYAESSLSFERSSHGGIIFRDKFLNLQPDQIEDVGREERLAI